FDRNSLAFGRITQAHGLPDNQVDIIGLDEGILWVATPRGLASADVRISDWQTYDLPGRIEGLAFDEKYVWVGGDFGIKRFDKYSESWENVTDLRVNDIFLENNYIWCATDSGVKRYNREFERMEDVPVAPRYGYHYIINTPGRIWFLSTEHFVAYKKDIEDWSVYNGFDINDYSYLNDSLFVVTGSTVYLYESRADNWTPFRDIEGLKNVNGIFTVQNNILFATSEGLILYNWQERHRKIYNRANGLEVDSLVDSYQDAEFTFVMSSYDIEFLDPVTDVWHVERLKEPEEKREKMLYIDEGGLHTSMVQNTDIKLQGRTYYSLFYSGDEVSDYENINMRLVGQHTSKRLFSVYYDDTDKEQVMYGFGYRGLDHDLLYRCNGGYFDSEYYEFDIIPKFSTLGGNAKLKYKEHNIALQTGQLKSSSRSDFFYGKSAEKTDTLLDIEYSRNTFYSIFSIPQEITKGYDTIFVDDRFSSTNEIDTKIEFTTGGITGDFDPLINGIDYFIDYHKGMLHFLRPNSDSDIIVLLINGQEIVIQSDMVQGRILENTYFVGPRIIPHSFSLTIRDTSGVIHPLSEFGLDNNGDDTVDAAFINYDLGYLMFPEPRPFPAQVYEDTINIYAMYIQFSSYSTFYELRHRPILINSEKVFVDGDLKIIGEDYIIDYTYGRLLFLRDDIVSDFSEVEVYYSSVEREREDMFYSAQPTMTVGNNIHIAPGISLIEDQRLFHVSAKFQSGREGDKGIRFIPQVAINDEKEWAQDYSLIAHYKIFSLNTEYRSFSERFEAFGARERKYGTLTQGFDISTRLEPLSYVRLEGRFTRERQVDSLNTEHAIQHIAGKLDYMNPKLPNGYILIGKDYLPDYEKRRIQINANYEVHAFDTKIKLNSIFRNDAIELDGGTNKNVVEYIVAANFSFPFALYGDIYFLRNNVYADKVKEKNEEELRATITMDIFPGLYYIGNYNLQNMSFYTAAAQDLSLKNYFYNTVNIAPGRWYSPLSIVNFSFGLGNNFDEYCGNLPAEYQKPFVLFKPLEDFAPSSINNVKNYYMTVQFITFSNLIIWGKHVLNNSGFAYYSVPDLKRNTTDEIRIEFEPGNWGLFIADWDWRTYRSYPAQTDHNVYCEWSKPWSARFRTKVSTNYRVEENDYGVAQTQASELVVNGEVLLRVGAKSYITVRMGGARQETHGNDITYSVTPGAGFNINLFTALFVQGEYVATVTLNNATTHVWTAKLIGQF
ncbi:MAG: hypothetical protein JSV97_01095, partial [candidate division WOR-3 bacterium]